MDDLDRLLTPQQLAAYLGVPVTTLYAWRYRGEGPPGFRVGKHLRYRWQDVERWVQNQLEPWSPAGERTPLAKTRR
jgi:excisionase family DNA binding protein